MTFPISASEGPASASEMADQTFVAACSKLERDHPLRESSLTTAQALSDDGPGSLLQTSVYSSRVRASAEKALQAQYVTPPRVSGGVSVSSSQCVFGKTQLLDHLQVVITGRSNSRDPPSMPILRGGWGRISWGGKWKKPTRQMQVVCTLRLSFLVQAHSRELRQALDLRVTAVLRGRMAQAHEALCVICMFSTVAQKGTNQSVILRVAPTSPARKCFRQHSGHTLCLTPFWTLASP